MGLLDLFRRTPPLQPHVGARSGCASSIQQGARQAGGARTTMPASARELLEVIRST